jgi:outer membrane protein
LLFVYELALQNDPQLREAENTRLATRESRPQAIAALLPQLVGSGSSSRETDRGTQNQVETVQDASGGGSFVESFPFDGHIATNRRQFGVDLKQSVFHWENWANLRRADAQVAQAEADYIVAQQDLMTRVAQSYFDVLAAQDAIAAQEAALESADRQLLQAEKRYDAGMIGIAEATEARAAHDSSAAAVIADKRTLASAIEVLREITATSFDNLSRPIDAFELSPPNPADEETWVDMAMRQNPALLSSRMAADGAQARVSAAYAGHLPSIDLVASRYKATSNGLYTTTDGEPFGSATLDQYQNKLGIQFTIPLFSGGMAASQVREAVYQHRAAKDRVERVTRQTEHDARDAYLGVISEMSRVKALERALESNSVALNATELSYAAGTRAAVDLLESRRLWLQAKTDFSRSRYDYMMDVLKLQRAAGILSLNSLHRLNDLLTETPLSNSNGSP